MGSGDQLISKDLSVVLPAFLEQENLSILLPRLNKVLTEVNMSYEIIVVDTQTPLDKTSEVCKTAQCVYLNRTGSNYFGDAVRTGIKAARGRYILFMDADGSHPPEFIPDLLMHKDSADVVIASRYVKGGYTENSLVQIWMSRVLNWSYSTILNLKCKDVSNSFKLYQRELFDKFTLRCDNFDIIEEILFKIRKTKKDLRIVEVPFSFKKRMFGETKRNLFLFILSYIWTILKLRFSAL